MTDTTLEIIGSILSRPDDRELSTSQIVTITPRRVTVSVSHVRDHPDHAEAEVLIFDDPAAVAALTEIVAAIERHGTLARQAEWRHDQTA